MMIDFTDWDYYVTDSLDPIDDWSGEYEFLRDDYPVSIMYEGLTYPSVAHAFQAAKTQDFTVRQQIADAPTAHEAKKIGRSVCLSSDYWNDRRVDVMYELQLVKYMYNKELQTKLANTGTRLIQMSHPRDDFWGVTASGGQNISGKLLVKIRTSLGLGPVPAIAAVVSAAPLLKVQPRNTLDNLEELIENQELAEIINELYTASKKAAEQFGEGSNAILKIIARRIVDDDDVSYSLVVDDLNKSVEKLTRYLSEQDDI